MKHLIVTNKFEELKKALESSDSSFKIHQILLRILNNETVNETEYGFEANVYQEEFSEGFNLYKALNESTISPAHLQEFKLALTFLVFKMGGFIKLMADTAMRKSVYLSQIENVYKVNPIIRDDLQSFIELLNQTNDKKAIANVAAAKAQISLSIGNLLSKPQIGQDMLQFAIGYADIGLKDEAVQIYKNILNDFESESVKLSSGFFPEITYADTRSPEEIEVFEIAKSRFEALTGTNLPEVKRAHVSVDANAKKIVDHVQSNEQQVNQEYDKQENTGFWGRLKKRFT